MPDLVYYPDDRPGISRRRCGRGFTYRAPDGTTIARGPERRRLEAMAVPPAYERVWMSPVANGHLMATGFDARARKQYRYHPDWSAAKSAEKFASLAAFGEALPRIRGRISRDLNHREAGEERFALAAALLLIDATAMRVGNEAYAAENGTYGATTLRRRHLRLVDGSLALSWRAKGGQKMNRRIRSRRLMRVLQAARDLPGAELFTWLDAGGTVRRVTSTTLNGYLADIGGCESFTAKTFRTWAGSLAGFEYHQTAAEGATIKGMTQAAAEVLANTPTVARSAYVHPRIIDLVGREPAPLPEARRGLSKPETGLLEVLA
ncbi:putative DNA topoisomerase I protein [Pseudooceanicola batsensis HTCC2597]|uniref:DNA topoisomerase n=1 Tax=Pseudooceanicola batsensis (strain ATCC BAA-863 / DSM 15984 / KCTC 12145 / HTCC2597) TaxID=252305 RepID=A3U462_PSEBH|nr:DNA topoisomerase IB [Pseudooceanicola batsensis]EAQ01049.1 putative DNA topoisomerase I protein [Pseudooceanicola batsensis HTCC2597]